jgi:hypothetical protein
MTDAFYASEIAQVIATETTASKKTAWVSDLANNTADSTCNHWDFLSSGEGNSDNMWLEISMICATRK